MWLVGGGGEVVEAMHQLMWKYKYKGETVECMFCTKKPTWLCSAQLLLL